MRKKRPYIPPKPAKPCEIVEVATGKRRVGTGEFPSRKKAHKALSKIIKTLPPKQTPDELDKYYIRNI